MSSARKMSWILGATLLTTGVMGSLYAPFAIRTAIAVVVVAGIAALAAERKSVPDGPSKVAQGSWERAAIEHLVDGVIVYDENFTIGIMNPAAEEILGVKSRDVIGQSFTLKVRREQSPALRALLAILFPALAPLVVRRSDPGVSPQVVDISIENPNLELRVTTFPIPGTPGGFMKLIHDRTRELAILREKSEFITVASHALRTPISGLAWGVEALRAAEDLGDETRGVVAQMAGATNRLSRIVEDLLTVAKIEEGRFGYSLSPIDLMAFLDAALRAAEPVAEQYNVKLYFEHPEGAVPITADAERLGMVLERLLDNAVKYNVKNGTVTVRVAPVSGKSYVAVQVQDTGIGMPEGTVQRAGTKFFRAENAMKANVDGVGLGLYIVRNIVRRHGGELWVESKLDRGTTVTFTLPTSPALIPPKEFSNEE